jgi:hypothetical protein
VDEGLAGLGDGLGADGPVALGGEAVDDAEAGLGPVRVVPLFELFERDLGVFADLDEGEGAVEEPAEEEGGLGRRKEEG